MVNSCNPNWDKIPNWHNKEKPMLSQLEGIPLYLKKEFLF